MTMPMDHRICLITGATGGIGKATAAELARMGATVVLGCRDRQRGEATCEELKLLTGNPSISVLHGDLSVQEETVHLASEFRERFSSLHVLINNAGAVYHHRQLTRDGIERTFALNHLAPFLLTNLLLDVMKKSAPARIINVTSVTYKYVRYNPANLQGELKYSPAIAYAQSKLANIYFTHELARRLKGSGVTVNCVHPGSIKTNIYNSTPLHRLYATLFGWTFAPPSKGAATVVPLAASPEFEGITGGYFQDNRLMQPSPHAADEQISRELWNISEQLTRSNLLQVREGAG